MVVRAHVERTVVLATCRASLTPEDWSKLFLAFLVLNHHLLGRLSSVSSVNRFFERLNLPRRHTLMVPQLSTGVATLDFF